MRVIRKGRPPKSLTEHRAEPVGTSYENLPKQEIWEALAKEQGFICAYCMSRIWPNKDHMKIDHRKAQHAEGGIGEGTALDYRNMLGVCKGGERLRRDLQHCDNVQSLKDARKSAVEEVVHAISNESPGQWSDAAIRQAITTFEGLDAKGRYKPFCGAILYFLRKRLARGSS